MSWPTNSPPLSGKLPRVHCRIEAKAGGEAGNWTVGGKQDWKGLPKEALAVPARKQHNQGPLASACRPITRLGPQAEGTRSLCLAINRPTTYLGFQRLGETAHTTRALQQMDTGTVGKKCREDKMERKNLDYKGPNTWSSATERMTSQDSQRRPARECFNGHFNTDYLTQAWRAPYSNKSKPSLNCSPSKEGQKTLSIC